MEYIAWAHCVCACRIIPALGVNNLLLLYWDIPHQTAISLPLVVMAKTRYISSIEYAINTLVTRVGPPKQIYSYKESSLLHVKEQLKRNLYKKYQTEFIFCHGMSHKSLGLVECMRISTLNRAVLVIIRLNYDLVFQISDRFITLIHR